jgi:isoaspartyl peptidase/L-asparaginase-like protein (Ntn-hydrolase superfamily)
MDTSISRDELQVLKAVAEAARRFVRAETGRESGSALEALIQAVERLESLPEASRNPFVLREPR